MGFRPRPLFMGTKVQSKVQGESFRGKKVLGFGTTDECVTKSKLDLHLLYQRGTLASLFPAD